MMLHRLIFEFVGLTLGIGGTCYHEPDHPVDAGPRATAPGVATMCTKGRDETQPPAREALTMRRDQLYAKLRKSVDSLEGVWKQQPDNTRSLLRYCEQIKTELKSLKESTSSAIADGRSPPANQTQTKEGSIGPAAVAVPQRKVAPEPGEIEKGRKATLEGTYLSGPPLKEVHQTLAQVPDSWIAKQCTSARKNVDVITSLLDKSNADAKAIADAINDLQKVVKQIAITPKMNPSTIPSNRQTPE